MSKRSVHENQGPAGTWQKTIMLKNIDPDCSTDDILDVACKVGKIEFIKWCGYPKYLKTQKKLDL